MAVIHDLLSKIEDQALRERIEQEVEKLTKQKKFGLVFEDHIPECTPLYGIPINVGCKVALKTGYMKDVYVVLSMDGEDVVCENKDTHEEQLFQKEDLVVVAEFGEAIYPYLKPVDSICNDPDSDLWHTLIEADNYHALQLLEYLYAGKVDCIYIDPPYNTGARDWKYNNDYVDSSDAYRHSKWLSMMEKRLRLAKKLLNPKDSVLIVTIDEKEYLHLGCLLEELFPEARMQMITSMIKPEGTQRRNEFSRTNEYIFFVMLGDKNVQPYRYDMFNERPNENSEDIILPYRNFRRTNSHSVRLSRPNQFYPIFVEVETGRIVGVGKAMRPYERKEDIVVPLGQIAIFPIRENGEEMIWYRTPEAFEKTIEGGYAYAQRTNGGFIIKYLSSNVIQQIENGEIVLTGRDIEGKLEGYYLNDRLTMPKTVWAMKSHNARDYGSLLIKKIYAGEARFTFPKSLYAVEDSIRLMVENKPNALIVDFFAGSGTTLHAVNLLNAEDGGRRRCIMVTNNEVSDEEAKNLKKKGYHPGDDEWEKLGIARYVTWPRTTCSIEGHDIKGEPLKGSYIGSDIPMAKGFKANAIYFKLGFLDKTAVALGRQFRELLPILWMKAGAIGPCPTLSGKGVPPMLILPENSFAVLTKENYLKQFREGMGGHPNIKTVYFVTDSEEAYKSMARNFDGTTTYQLYRDYLDNFRINIRR